MRAHTYIQQLLLLLLLSYIHTGLTCMYGPALRREPTFFRAATRRSPWVAPADLQKLSNCPLMTAAAVDSAGAKLSTHDHERLHTGSAGAHPSRKFSSRAPRAAEAVDSPAPAVDSRASCPPTPPYLSTHENEHLDTCSAGAVGVFPVI